MISNVLLQGKDFQWFLDNKLTLGESYSDKCILIKSKCVQDTYDSLDSAILDLKSKLDSGLDIMIEKCSNAFTAYESLVRRLEDKLNIYRFYIVVDMLNDASYICMEVGELMPIGTQVYCEDLKLNLIVCQINSGNKILCINPQIINDNRYQVLTISASRLSIGWHQLYE